MSLIALHPFHFNRNFSNFCATWCPVGMSEYFVQDPFESCAVNFNAN